MKYQSILFDIGNVLLPIDFSGVFSFFAANCDAYSGDELDDRIRELATEMESGKIDGSSFLDKMREKVGFRAGREEFLEVWNSIFRPHPVMWEFVASLQKQGTRLYLFSNTNDFHQDHFMEKYDVFRHFEGGIFSQKIGFMKPDPGFYQTAIDTLPIDPASTIYIDDAAENVEAGRKFGFEAIQYDKDRHEDFAKRMSELGFAG